MCRPGHIVRGKSGRSKNDDHRGCAATERDHEHRIGLVNVPCHVKEESRMYERSTVWLRALWGGGKVGEEGRVLGHGSDV